MSAKRLCTFPACGKKHYAKGLCEGHYLQQRRGQQLRLLRNNARGKSIAVRLADYSQDEGDCRAWTENRDRKGYGYLSWDGRTWRAHRAAYVVARGPIPDDKVINHICGNRACIKVSHLELVTMRENNEYRTVPERRNTSGHRGVTFDKKKGRYRAQVHSRGTNHYLGLFATAEEAAKAAAAGRARLHSMPEFEDRFAAEEATA